VLALPSEFASPQIYYMLVHATYCIKPGEILGGLKLQREGGRKTLNPPTPRPPTPTPKTPNPNPATQGFVFMGLWFMELNIKVEEVWGLELEFRFKSLRFIPQH